MDTYRITPAHDDPFTVDASNVNQAVHAATNYAHENSVLAGPATLARITDDGDQHIANFDLDGHTLPQTWGELQDMVKATRQRALQDAKTTTDYPCHYSRGVTLAAEDAKGNTVLCAGDCWDLDTTLKAHRKTVARLLEVFPDTVKIWAEAGVDSAESVYAQNMGDEEPWTGEAVVLIWRRGHKGVAN
ncbi:MAG: hypothetical protein AWU57_625 [Marinobacter sp. T13-3]|nr:MAG: hypothetical protein AWU57_625 [Marinobacter sp. T13-3]